MESDRLLWLFDWSQILALNRHPLERNLLVQLELGPHHLVDMPHQDHAETSD